MIKRIGVVCQDANSLGFIKGIQRRLNCEAELIEPTGGVGRSTTMTRRQARIAAAHFRSNGADLIVRFTDADGNPWQQIRRQEQHVFPVEVNSILVCAVAVENTEQWLALDRKYVRDKLGIQSAFQLTNTEITEVIKSSIKRLRLPSEPASEVTARLVAEAPSEVFRTWLKADGSLLDFYQQCRAAALRENCPVPNELD